LIVREKAENRFTLFGFCSHEHVHFVDGLVMDDVIEYPKHNAQFDYKPGEAVRAPACIDL